ncbi:MAG: transposase [Anaerocolumna sp.]|nr:transposase [Anaerocolumna sp.]
MYRDPKTGNLYAVDSQHGTFEVTNAHGQYQGEFNFNRIQTKTANNQVT